MSIEPTNNPRNVTNDKTPKNLTVTRILVEELLEHETPWTKENHIFKSWPNTCYEGDCLTLIGINNKTTKSDLRRVLLTCGEVKDITLITKPLPNGTKMTRKRHGTRFGR